MASQKDLLDEIADELVVFKHEDPNHPDRYFSNDPRWNDSRIKQRWLDRHSDEAKADADEEVVDEGDDDLDPYEAWTNDELRGELAKRGLSVDGKKADMVARLEADDEKAAKE